MLLAGNNLDKNDEEEVKENGKELYPNILMEMTTQ